MCTRTKEWHFGGGRGIGFERITSGQAEIQELSYSVNSKARFGIRNDYDLWSKKSRPVPDPGEANSYLVHG
ncbi:MAG: hypothetical protein WBE45_00140 [Terriglobales bacterium]